LSFHPIPDAELEEQIHTSELDDVFRRGYRVLVDKDGITAGLPPADERHRPHPIPDPAAFMRLVNIYWYGAVYVAKQIVRGQSWLVKYRDWTNKEMLLRMLEWHALAIYGADHDVWHDGKFIGEWAEPEALGALEGCFGHFDAADSWRALLNSMTLFRRLAMDVAAEWELDYPARLDTQVTAYIMNLYGESG
jgi:aminoglycoside 6-adenylyltransferase